MDVILKAVDDEEWQELRVSLKGTSLKNRYVKLSDYVILHQHSDASKIRVTNYVNALRRGGMVKRKSAK